MNYTFVALAENKPGVMNRVASLFRRRNFNIEFHHRWTYGKSEYIAYHRCGGLSQWRYRCASH